MFVLLNGLQDSLSVFGSLEADLFTHYISIFPFDPTSCFCFSFYTQKLIFVPQPHLMFYCCYKPSHNRSQKLSRTTFRVNHISNDICTFSHCFLLLYRLLLFAKVLLIEDLLLRKNILSSLLCAWDHTAMYKGPTNLLS